VAGRLSLAKSDALARLLARAADCRPDADVYCIPQVLKRMWRLLDSIICPLVAVAGGDGESTNFDDPAEWSRKSLPSLLLLILKDQIGSIGASAPI